MATNGQTQTRQDKTYDFKPVDYDINEVEPDAAPGEYEAVIDEVKISKTNADSYPMLIIEWKLTATASDEEACEKSVGASLADFLVFFPPGHKGLKMGKLRMRALNDKLGIDNDVVPTRISSKADLQDYAAALKGQTATVWVAMQKDNRSGEESARVVYKAPKGSAAALEMPDDEEEEAPRAAKASAKGKATAKRR